MARWLTLMHARLTKQLSWLLALSLTASTGAAAERMITRASNLHFGLASDDSLIIELYQQLWLQPAGERTLVPLAKARNIARRPSISANGEDLVYQSRCDTRDCVIHLNRRSGASRELFSGDWNNQMPVISADGSRVALSSDKDGSFDIWEIAIDDSGLRKRSFASGNELYPALSADANRTIWVQRSQGYDALVVAEGAAAGHIMYRSSRTLSSPSERPGGGVLVFWESAQGIRQLRALIGGDAPVIKSLSPAGKFSDQAPIWRDRAHLLLAGRGQVLKYNFGERGLATREFVAWLSTTEFKPAASLTEATHTSEHRGRYVVRVGSVLNGLDDTATGARDILIDDERIVAIVTSREWPANTPLIRYPEFIATPGWIGVYLEAPDLDHIGSELLANGVTSLACLATPCQPPQSGGAHPAIWPTQVFATTHIPSQRAQRAQQIAEARSQGRRVLTRQIYPDLTLGATLLVPSDSATARSELVTLMEDAGISVVLTRKLDPLLQEPLPATQRFLIAESKERLATSDSIVQRIARLLSLSPDRRQLFQRLTLDTASAVGADAHGGLLLPGRYADILILARNPLQDPHSIKRPIAIIQQGRFYTPEGLIGTASGNFTKHTESGTVAD